MRPRRRSLSRCRTIASSAAPNSTPRRICIVGASGKLGQYMVQHALDRGYEVVGVCREASVGKLARFAGAHHRGAGPTNDREVIRRAVAGCDGVLTVLAPWGVQQYASGTAQAVLDFAPEPARAWSSRAAGTSRATARTCTRALFLFVVARRWLARLLRFAELDDQVEACRRIFASDRAWTVVRGSDLEEGESQGLPVWSRHVGDPCSPATGPAASTSRCSWSTPRPTRRSIHEAPAIVGCRTASALAHAGDPALVATPAGPAPLS
jgi:hypothetical protein